MWRTCLCPSTSLHPVTIRNAFGETIYPIEDPTDLHYVPPSERKDTDDDPDADALGVGLGVEDFGDDLDGWQVGDPV